MDRKMGDINYLKGVFWEYPQFTREEYVLQTLERARRQKDIEVYRWMMRKFLEHGRVVDTLRFFPIDEIAEHLGELRLSPYIRRKWQRLVEVYLAT